MNKALYNQELIDWNQNAPHYELENKLPFQAIIKEEIFRKSGLSSQYKTILDAGCGAGHLTSFLQQKTQSQIIGFDFADEMIEVARKNYPAIHFVRASADKLPFKDEAFEAILAVSLLHHLKVQGLLKKGVKEFYRILKPKGIFFTLDRQDNSFTNLFEVFFAFCKVVFKNLKPSLSTSGSSHETVISKEDITLIKNQGFILVAQGPICSLSYKILGVLTNLIFYTLGVGSATFFQKITFSFALFSENYLNFDWFSTDRYFVFKKHSKPSNTQRYTKHK